MRRNDHDDRTDRTDATTPADPTDRTDATTPADRTDATTPADGSRGRRRRLVATRPLDYVALVLSILAVVGTSVFAYGGRTQPSSVSIENEDGVFLYPLDQDRVIDVPGPLGTTVVEIEDSRVHVHESPCRDKLCIAAGWLDTTGQWTACLPNIVFVRVEGGEPEDGIDAQTF